MSRIVPVLSALLLVACGKSEPTTLGTSGSDTDTETTEDTDTQTDTQTGTDTATTGSTDETGTTGSSGGCSAVTAATDWAWHGQCPQMTTPCEIQVNGCDLTITYSSGMTMGMPSAGVVTGSDVTFNASGSVTGCIGTVIDADTIEGTCDGCSYTLNR